MKETSFQVFTGGEFIEIAFNSLASDIIGHAYAIA